jgi:hypothetical protein
MRLAPAPVGCLDSLNVKTTYCFMAEAASEVSICGAEKSFTTIDASVPVISPVNRLDIAVADAIMMWPSNEATTTQLEHGSVAPHSFRMRDRCQKVLSLLELN